MASRRTPLAATRRRADARGMTLIELLMAISIMALIMAAVPGLVVFVARTLSPTQGAAAQSNNAMLTSALFANDVAQAATFTTTAPSGCGSAAGTTLAWFQTADGSGGYLTSVWYQYGGTQVTRTDCRTGARLSVADQLQAGSTPVVKCLNGTTTPTSCSTRGSSTGLRLTLTLSSPTALGGSVGSSLVLTGAWMISGQD